MKVLLTNDQDLLAIDEERFESEVAQVAREAGLCGELSVALVADSVIAVLNERYLGHEGPTDVLAFPLEEEEGEIVVSAERAVLVAKELGVAPLAELMLYVVHGILHLAGHDDHEEDAARRMHAETLKLLRVLGYRNRIGSWG